MEFEFAVAVIVAVFVTVDPIGNVPFYVALTDGYSRKEKRAVINKVVIVALTLLILFAFLGNYIFAIFNITIPAFRIAGGILLFGIALSMLHGSSSKTKLTEKDRKEALMRDDIGIVPLGIPIFAGPGAITTVMIYMAETTSNGFDILGIFIVILAIIITMVLSYIILVYGQKIFKRMGRNGTVALTRIMGLILAAMSVQFVLTGIINFAINEGLIQG